MFNLRLICACLGLALFACARSATAQQQRPQTPVLDLDGTNSWVELPPNVYNDLTEATIEAWVKWRSFSTSENLFCYGESFHDLWIGARPGGDLTYSICEGDKGLALLSVPGLVRTNDWCHLAAICGPGGMKLWGGRRNQRLSRNFFRPREQRTALSPGAFRS
jgi:hypothetical protein